MPIRKLLPLLLFAVAATPLIRAQTASPLDVLNAIEEEKNAYLARDDHRMADIWIQQPTSMKIYVYEGKQTRIEGFDAIRRHDQENLQKERAGTNRLQFSFSDSRVTLQGDSAWVVLTARFDGVANGSPVAGTQSRVYILRQEYGRWKIALLEIAVLSNEQPPTVTALPKISIQ